ncbi:MAG: aldehyde dehydrogenase EutE [Chloroflexi bacterium]|nr:aldehyde dehydrogenase EutE [Chloroflexota bacterium]
MTTQLTEQDISNIVQQVLSELKTRQNPATVAPAQVGVFNDVTSAATAAQRAQKLWMALPLEKRKEVIAHVRERLRENAQVLAWAAWRETGLGRYEDKIEKNLLNINKVPGIEDLEPMAWSGDRGLTVMERAPFGVIGSITPTTNPTATVIGNALAIIAGGNAVVFNPHPSAKECCARAIVTINQAIIEAGGPANLVTGIANPTIESAQELMKHPGTALTLVTGGGEVVKVAMSSGKRAICAGPGNPPVVVDETADLELAAKGIIKGASFDNNIICTDEKVLVVVESVADQLINNLRGLGARILTSDELQRLEKIIFSETPKLNHHTGLNKKLIGQNLSVILKEIGVTVGDEVRLGIAQVPREHTLVWTEQMMPVLPLVRVKNADEAIDFGLAAEGNRRHTAVIYSRQLDNLSRMAKESNVSIFVKNGPNLAGLGYGGEGFCSFSIAGTTGEGMTRPRTFTRERRCTLVDSFRIV